jgi:hypothetical protein
MKKRLYNKIILWLHAPMEYEEFIGYNHSNKRYVFHGVSIEGDEDPSEDFGYAYRTGNEFKTVAKFGTDILIVQWFTLQTAYRAITNADSWNIKSAWVIAGKKESLSLKCSWWHRNHHQNSIVTKYGFFKNLFFLIFKK